MQLLRPESLPAAVAALGNGSIGIAGGTEVVPLTRDRIVAAETLVDLSRALPRGVDGTRIGAGTSLRELEVDPEIPEALREACRLAASPQLRAMGTVGGNLRQATRCWYWRLKYPCYLHGGDACHAREGEHREHAIFANYPCASAHPSDVAAALLALGAHVVTSQRELPLAELYRLPTDDNRDVVSLEPDELILELDVPQPEASAYLKAMDRRRWAFPIVGVGAARTNDDLRFGLAGVAPIPWAVSGEEDLDAATPLAGTAYKVELARTLVRRARAAVGG
ncbi:MAG TPA: FAD binding domain-containing protein [Gaiellaceae bacterium]|nr:FAD binding domain-containing protein [Gaiellaceae bacterium]